MEVLVAADRKMQEYHGSNIVEYILTLMSIVSNVYSDASIGNSINIAVVHILMLKDEIGIEPHHSASKYFVLFRIAQLKIYKICIIQTLLLLLKSFSFEFSLADSSIPVDCKKPSHT